jgi:hypothetical protein
VFHSFVFFAQYGVDVLQILSCFILHRRSVQKFGRNFFLCVLFFVTLPLFSFAYIVKFYKKKQVGFTLHLLFNIKFFFLLKSKWVEEQLSLIGTICSVWFFFFEKMLFSDFVFMKFNRVLLAVEHKNIDKLQTLP